jgi:cytochrome c biogenesis protein CcmG, thiol:disulfide interchange protein DsbE
VRADRRRRVSVVSAVLVLLAAFVVMLGSGMGSGTGVVGRSPLVDNPAPPLAGRTLDGSFFRLERLEGSVVLVNVWASWCGPCRDEMPLLAAAQQKWTGSGLEVVGINTRDGPVAARALLRETGATGVRSVLDPDGRLAVAWGASGVPETFLVDRGGIVRARHVGPVTEQWLRRHVPRWLSR